MPYSDTELADAIAANRSWRVVPRTLGLAEISVVDRNLDAYLIPISLVANRYSIVLSAYSPCLAARRGDWLSEASSP